VLQSSTDQWQVAFALGIAAVHWCGVTADLHDEQPPIGVIAVSQACSQPVLLSSTDQWEVTVALSIAAVHWCGVIADLHDQQPAVAVIAVSQTCSQPVLHSSTDQWEVVVAFSTTAVHFCGVTADLHDEQPQEYHKPALSLFCTAALTSGKVCSDAKPMPCSTVLGKMHSPLFNAAL